MSGINYLANALLIDSIDTVRNKLLDAYNYVAIHRLQIDEGVEDNFNLASRELSDVLEELAAYISLPIYDPLRADAVESARTVLKRTYEVINEAEKSNDKRIETSKESTILLESYGEKLAFAAFAAYETIRNFGAVNE